MGECLTCDEALAAFKRVQDRARSRIVPSHTPELAALAWSDGMDAAWAEYRAVVQQHPGHAARTTEEGS